MSVETFMPVIVEATKFVFGEAGKWLENIRKQDNKSTLETSQARAHKDWPVLTQQEFTQLEANPTGLMSAINVQMAKTNVHEIKGLVKQIQTHRRNLTDLETIKSEYGSLTPLHIMRSIEHETSATIEKSLLLKNLLEQIYGKKFENTQNI